MSVPATRSSVSLWIRHVVCALTLSLVLAACTPPPGGSSNSNSLASLFGVPQPGGGVPPELQNLFAKAPYEPNESFSKQYPRVAFTVLSSPPVHAQNVQILVVNGGDVPRGCWSLSATIWTNEKASKDTGPFTVCMPDILTSAYGVPLNGYNNWALAGQTMLNVQPGEQTTGNHRTTGPIPPNTPFPTSAHYTAYYGWQGGVNGRYPGGNTEEGYMWAGLLYIMGFDWQNIEDRRVWVYKYVPVEG